MIKKTRINFVVITMTLLALVIMFFVGSNILINYQTSRRETKFELFSMLSRPDDGPAHVDQINKKRTAVFDCTFLGDDGVVVDSGTSSGDVFASTEEIIAFVDKVVVDGKVVNSTKLADGMFYGSEGTLYYMLQSDSTCYKVRFAVIDRQMEESMLRNTSVTLCVVSLVALVAIFVIVWVLSYRVVKPVADAFDKQKRFISDASHELKTPVTIIRANAEALQMDVGDNEWADNILSQTDRLSHLVEEMLTLARLEEQAVVKEDVDVSSLVESTSLEFEPLAYEKERKFTCNVDDDINMHTSRGDLRRVVTLLLDNAVKYSDSFVSVTLTKLQRGAKLTVLNDGCQVPSEHKDKLTERFYREDTSRARETGGNGLGLATVKAICDKNKWKLNLDCEQGGNMSVVVDLS